MHKNYNTCLHILDMHVERGGHQFSRRNQILVCFVPINLLFWAGYSILGHYIMSHKNLKNQKMVVVKSKLKILAYRLEVRQTGMTSVYETHFCLYSLLFKGNLQNHL